jgi:hypothetical protein
VTPAIAFFCCCFINEAQKKQTFFWNSISDFEELTKYVGGKKQKYVTKTKITKTLFLLAFCPSVSPVGPWVRRSAYIEETTPLALCRETHPPQWLPKTALLHLLSFACHKDNF